MGGRIARFVGVGLLFWGCAATASSSPSGAGPATLQSSDRGRADTSTLWTVLDPSVAPNDGAKTVQAFRDRLLELPPASILSIDQELINQLDRSYTWKLWGAAYIINGGCSDDCFDYFRAWLIMQGSAVFNSALRDPDSLADYAYLQHPAELEEALSVTREAYRTATGKEPHNTSSTPSLGPGWDFDDQVEMKHRYPRLCRKFNC
jgi:hypothetical protein